MSAKEIWAGLDVAKRKFDAVLATEGEEGICELAKGRFPMGQDGANEFAGWALEVARNHGSVALQTIMEATGRHSVELAGILEAAGLENKARIVNPRLIHYFSKSLGLKNKTDSLDASAIARYGLERRPKAPREMSSSQRELQRALRARADLVKIRTSVILQAQEAAGCKLVLDAFASVKACIEKQIDSLEREMTRIVEEDSQLREDAKLLISIPGFGKISVFTVLGELGDLRRFARRGQLAAFVGLNPVRKESGSCLKHGGGISKAGSHEVRRVLHLAARAAVYAKTPNSFQLFYNKKIKDGKPKLSALTAVMRKILLVARAILIENKPFSINPC